ncbi:MAG: hypothetical protein RR225_05340 [Clostridium sp.]
MSREKARLYMKICDRAEKLFYKGNKVCLLMDIESADKVFDLRLEDLLNADDFNFSHDISGIVNNAVRADYPATDFNGFVPRFAR